MDRSILFLSFLALCFSFQLSKEQESTNEGQREENFQTRRVYYSNEENVCRGGDFDVWPSEIQYEITFEDGREKVTGSDILGGVTCDTRIFAQHPISVMKSFYYQNEDCPYDPSRFLECNKVVFQQEQIVSHMVGKLVGIWVKITGVSSARFKKEYFDCVIKGDKTIQHYYVKDVFPMPLVRTHCTLNETKTAEMAKSEIKVE